MDIFKERYKEILELPRDAQIDIIGVTYFQVSEELTLPVCEIRYKRATQEEDYILIQLNSITEDLTVYDRKWTGEK